MFDWVLGPLGSLFGFVGDVAGEIAGWTWEKVIVGFYSWLANGLALMVEWVWSVLDSGTTPRVANGWFANELTVRLGVLALAVTIAMMLASATQAALAGRPEQILDAVKHGIWAIVASALTVAVIDVLLGIVDEASALVWESGRADLVKVIEEMAVVITTSGPLAQTFVGPLCLAVGFLSLGGLALSLMMRSALLYLAAALAPVVWSANVLPLFRGAARKLIHLTVALIVSKLAIAISLVVAVRLIANPGGDPDAGPIINDGAAAVGTLMTGFICFFIAAISPLVLYKLMPTVEGAVVSAGIAGGWVRGATTTANAALMVKSLGASAAASAATRPVAGAAAGTTTRSGIVGLPDASTTGSTRAPQQPNTPSATGAPSTPGSARGSDETTLPPAPSRRDRGVRNVGRPGSEKTDDSRGGGGGADE